ncbi:hypothetical protein DES36_1058 [Alkalibaculum bacchi]|uniref:Uncharacterized protein n=1 Tax=Alkalibaculum bacchi TaxID=645887 RepID=A0A366IBI3_9FIRM|nr:DUF6483 family protein [Alkalibaculum bacchi]RBP66629.1 hypothetical protein DES36_1058 [Alkalibaculum bacchi]
MIKQDYIMRMVDDLIRLLAKLFFNKDTISYELPSEENYTQTDYLYKQLLNLIGKGKINEAENLLFQNIDSNDKRYMELALDFYAKLNNLDDELLEKSNFPREEIEQGVKEIAKVFGLSLF